MNLSVSDGDRDQILDGHKQNFAHILGHKIWIK